MKKTLFTLTVEEGESGEITVNSLQNLSGQDLDLLIEQLSIARMQTLPPVPEDPSESPNADPHIEPFLKWAAGGTPEQGQVLGIRHSGLGWLWFRPPHGFAHALSRELDATSHQKPLGH